MNPKHDFMWSTLVHLGSNFWFESDNKACLDNLTSAGIDVKDGKTWQIPASDTLRLDRTLWNEYMDYLRASGVNTIVLDIGDGIVYDSHPELAIKGSWSGDEIRAEAARLNAMGFEIVPKLNFSTTHDVWMKEYSRMVSTPTYYKVCEDLINEVCEIFKPRYFHLGMDEEGYPNQRDYNYVTIRQNDLWWRDLYRLVDTVEKNNARAMMWSDYARHRPDEFVQKCPKSVVQCVWYYFSQFYGELSQENEIRVRPFEIMEKHGFDQLPGGSNCYFRDNFEMLTKYCKDVVSPEHLKGFLQTTWESVTPRWREQLFDAADCVKNAKDTY